MWALRPQYENKGSNKLCWDLEDQINCVAAYLCADVVFVIALDLSTSSAQPFAFLSIPKQNIELKTDEDINKATLKGVEFTRKMWPPEATMIKKSPIVPLNGFQIWSKAANCHVEVKQTREGESELNSALFGDKEGARETVATQEISRKININLGRGS